MIASISVSPEKWYTSVHELLRSAFVDYEVFFTRQEHADLWVDLQVEPLEKDLVCKGSICNAEGQVQSEKTWHHPLEETEEPDKQISRLVRIFIFEWMSEFWGEPLSEYGILSGVRPLKILHRCLDQHWDQAKIIRYMEQNFRVSASKARFLLEVAENNHALLNTPEEARTQIGMYIGIPYCPTRCYYCSFPGAILRRYEQEIPPFLQALYREITVMGDYLRHSPFQIQNLYIGGGTPTVLNEKDLSGLLEHLQRHLDLQHCVEFTVEAGRPDTLNSEKLHILHSHGVDRICINPQTMNNATLERIGRKHTAEQIEETVFKAKEIGIENINMDLIVGLAGEGQKEYQHTIERILDLQPSNITVHSLAVKRGSVLAEKEGLSKVSGQAAEIAEGMRQMAERLHQKGYIPYYLYRQKYMKANLENTGYTWPGQQCLYNVQMMEERQTILGLGGGSSSKFVHPEDWTLTSFHNPKDPKSYQEHLERCIQAKLDNLKALSYNR